MIAMSASTRAGNGRLTLNARTLALKLLSGLAATTPSALMLALALFATSALAAGPAPNALGTCDTAGPIEVEATAGDLGPTAYATLKAAFDAINAGTPQGAINIEVCGNTTETVAAVINASGAGSAVYTTIAIKPVGGAARTITGALATPLIDFSGADNVTIDGLNTGGNSLTISNTSTAATTGTSTIRFIGDATNNTVTNSSILGSATVAVATDGGNIVFSTGTTTGNDGNTVSNCDIGPAGANLPIKLVYASGTTATATQNNSGVVINNNNLFDFFGATAASRAIDVQVGNTDWTISNNKIYQTATRTWTTGAEMRGISVNNSTSANNMQVTGNTIGFASSAGTGTFTITGGANLFKGIHLIVAATTASNIQNNTVANISQTTTTNGTTTSAAFMALYPQTGLITTTGNTIGSLTGTGSISYSSSSSSTGDVLGIFNFSSQNALINNNSIGSITVTDTSTGAIVFHAIKSDLTSANTATVSGNIVGGTTANSINNTATAVASRVVGWIHLTGISSFTGNTIRNMTMSAGNTGTAQTASVVGILQSVTANTTISQNTVFSLSNTNATLNVSAVGVAFLGGTANTVSKNSIYDLSVASSGTTATVDGLVIGTSSTGATTNVSNNLIGNLTAPNAANGTAISSAIRGIAITSTAATSTLNLSFNTIYLNASSTGANFGTTGLFHTTSTTATTAALNLRDNVIVNRSTPAGTGLTVAYRRSSGTANTLANYGSASNNNDFYAGTPGVANLIYADGTSNAQTISAYKGGIFTAGTIAPRDSASINENPPFLSTTGSSANFLHIDPTVATQLESGGIPVSGITDDFDGNVRNATTPDMGADEFAGIVLDLTPPTISYTALGNTSSTSNRSLSSTITDATGVPTSGTGLPVLYYRKGVSDPYVAAQAVSGGGSAYSFTINYALVSGGSVTSGDVIQYYIVAQDTVTPTPNVGANPSAGATGFTANPPAAGTPPTTPSSYTIVGSLSGTKTVGGGGDYATLTSATGLFADINAKVVTGNLTINLLGDLTEDGATALNQWAEDGPGNYTLTIQSSAATLRTISGAVAAGMIRLNGADRVTFDGRVGGTGQFLLFRNTSTSGPTFTFLNDATNNTIESSLVEGASTSTVVGTILFGTSTGTLGNSGNKIQFSDIRDRSDAAGVPANAVYSAGSAGAPNAANMISACNVFNWTNAGVLVSATGAGNGWTINPSNFYQTAARTTPMTGISIQGGSGHSILGNSIGGTAVLAGGANLATNQAFRGIDLLVGTASPTSVQGNVVKNIRSSLAGSFTSSYGIFLQAGTANIGNVSGNTIGSSNVAERYEISGDSYGIRVVSTSTVNVSNNVVNNFTTAAGVPTGEFYFGMSIEGAAGIHSVINNTVTNVTNGSTPDASFNTQTIGINVAASGVQTVRGNTISNIGSTSTVASTTLSNRVWGMIISGTAAGTQVEKNAISNIYASSASAGARVDVITGLQSQTLANATYSNNMVSSTGSSDGVTASDRAIFGILDLSAAPSVSNYFFNSVNISGTATAANGTYAFNRNSTATTTLRNNIFADTRSGGTGFHVAMANTNAAATGWTATASNYNLLFNAVPANLTQWLGAAAINNQTLAGFQTASGGDANSLNADPLFVSASNLHLQVPPALSPAESAGTPFGSVTTDIDNDSRPATKPDIGADELVSNLTITPATVAFGNLPINTTSGEMTVTLANTGAGSLDVTTLDAAAAPFARTGTGTCSATLPITIASGANCTLTYTFAPTAAGPASQTLTVTSNGPGSGTIALSGTGTQGNLTITPTSVPFGNQLVGTTSTELTVTLANTGNASLDVTALTAAAAPFARTGTGTCAASPPITIAASGSCTLTYTFAPTATGPANQTLTVTANAPGSGTIALSGTGTQGNLTITPTSVPFGNVAVGSNSGPTAVTLANTGSASLTVTALTDATAPFSRVGGNCSVVPITIPAGGSCTVGYQFAPTATGPFNQTLTVTANAPGSGTIALSGNGTQGNLTISPTSVPFGNQAVGSTSGAMTVTLGNTGGASLQVTALTPAAAPFALSGGSCGSTPITIPASGACTLTYTFAPTAAGPFNQTLTVTANAPGSGTIALSGTGVQGTLTITPPSINYGTQTLNTTSPETTVTLANTGVSSLNVTALTAAAAPFARTATGSCSPTLPITIPSSGSCTLTYTFTPTVTGPASQTLTVTTDGTGSGTIALSGTGAGPGGVCSTGLPIEVSASAGTPGPTGYANLKAGFDSINAGVHQGSIQMSVCADTTEAATAALNASGVGPSVYTSVLVTPANGAARLITGSLAAPLVDLNGADNVTIDGLNTSGNALTMSNTSTSNVAGTSTIRFIDGATGNRVTNSTILGSSLVTLPTAGGTVYFATDAITPNGNDTNTISNNNIGPAGAALPIKAVFGLGTLTTLSNANSGVVIDNNNIYDFFGTGAASVSAVNVIGGNDNWTISNNRIYQTAPRTFTGTALRYAGITLNSSGSFLGTFIVAGNRIGFGAANGTGTTTISGSTNTFRGIDAPNVNATTPTSIQGNTISGINQTTASTGSGTTTQFVGMMLATTGGRFDVGDVAGNTIGSLDGSSTIVINSTAGTGTVIGLYDFGVSSNTFANNRIGSFAIQGVGGTNGFRGILINTGAGVTATVTGNTIASITNTQVGSYSLYGIQTLLPAATMNDNVVRNITGNSNGGVVVVAGINVSAGTASNPSLVARNTVHSLRNTVVGGASGAIYGLDFTFPAQANVVERNIVHSLSVDTTFVGYQVVGILMRGGAAAPSTTTFRNNMVRLGLDAAGASVTAPLGFTGIRDSAGTNIANNYYHNSVYIGGSGVTGGAALTIGTTAFSSDVVTTTRNFQDNIFWNARSNVAAGAALHIAIRAGGTTANPPGLTSNYNDLYATGNDGVVGVYNGFIYPTLADWQTVTGQDANSFAEDPKFIAPNGTALTGDLHINPSIATPIEGTGLAIATVTNDFDGDIRASFTPTDVGADAGNFIPQIGNLTISPTSVAFGNLAVGATSAEATVVLGNSGTGTLRVTALTAPTTPFARTATGTCSATVPITIVAGGSCTLTYRFSPTTNGPFDQTLTVTANVPGSGTIALSGTGVQGNLTITPTNVAFGNQTVGTTSSAMAVQFVNVGNAALTVTSLTAPAAPFGTEALIAREVPAGFVNCGAAPFTLAAGAGCAIGYTFSPTATGPSTQMLTATTSGLGGGTITLSGTGVQGALTINPTAVAFANQSVGTTSPASTVTLSNTGNATLNVTTLTAATSPFARQGGSCGSVPIAIAAGSSCTLTYTFAPTVTGAANQTLTVTSDAPGSGTIALSGTGVQGNLVVSPSSVDFGSPDLFTTTAFKSVTLSNTGAGSLQVTSLTLAATPFVRTADGSCGNSLPITIAAGASCTITYAFAPTTAGSQSQVFTVSTNGPGSGMFTLTGNGIGDRIFQDGFDGPAPPEPTP